MTYALNQTPQEVRDKIGTSVKKSWEDPATRAYRIAAIKAAQQRRRQREATRSNELPEER